MIKKINHQAGLTLLELMIAISLFTIVMLISTTMFLRSIEVQARSINSKNLQEGLNFTLTIMANEAAGAKVNPTSCNISCAEAKEFFCVLSSGTQLVFKNANDECVNYEGASDLNGTSRLEVTRGTSTDWLTPGSFKITDIKFSSTYADDATYPVGRVTLFLKGQSLTSDPSPAILQVQTTAATWPGQ